LVICLTARQVFDNIILQLLSRFLQLLSSPIDADLLKNNPAKLHPNPISNDRALGFFEEIAPTTRRRRT